LLPPELEQPAVASVKTTATTTIPASTDRATTHLAIPDPMATSLSATRSLRQMAKWTYLCRACGLQINRRHDGTRKWVTQEVPG
jgi:hypothetical protein